MPEELDIEALFLIMLDKDRNQVMMHENYTYISQNKSNKNLDIFYNELIV